MSYIKKLLIVIFILMNLTPLMGSTQWNQTNSVAQAQVVFEFSEVVVAGGDPRERAVAFHSITFIDSIAHPIGEIIFGTAEANALQGDGWFKNEVSAEAGSFQWAGGATKQAIMQLTIPTGTEGLLLKIISVKDSLRMDVKIDGELAATLCVDAYWHSGYVPIGEAVPEPVINSTPEWLADHYFPHFPSTDRIYALRVPLPLTDWSYGTVSGDWRINQSYKLMMDLTLVGIQGIINRSKSRLYIDWYEPVYIGTVNDGSGLWTPLLEKHVDVVKMDLDGLSAINFFMRRYASYFSGAVVYDPQVPETINLATMIAGLEDRVMLAPEQIGLPGIPDFDSVTDLRELVQQQGWDSSEDSKYRIYQWVYDNLWPRLEHRIIGIISPGPPTSRETQPGIYYQLGLVTRDYHVALRLPVLWLSPVDEPQASLFSKFLDEAPSPIPITGVFWNNEHKTVKLAARHGDWVAGISWPGWAGTGGLSALSGVRPEIIQYQPKLDRGRILATLGDGPVATMFSTDGDAIYYQMTHGFRYKFAWESVQNQRFGWTINPTLTDLAPVIWNNYVESRSGVELLTGISGAGYTFPQEMNDTQLDSYLSRTATYMDETGIRVVRVSSGFGATVPLTKEVMARYFDSLHQTQYVGAIPDFIFNQGSFDFDYFGGHVPSSWVEYTLGATNQAEVIEKILSQKMDEVFLDAEDPNVPHQGQVVQDADAHGGQAVFIPRGHATSWAVWSNSTPLAPGTYNATFCLKVTENQDAGHIASISVMQPSPSYHTLAFQYLAPVDFQQAGQYQNFTISFTLDRFATDMEFVVEYYESITDLYIDYIHIQRENKLALPYFATVLIRNLSDAQADTPGKFTQAFESAGGIVLTPDEFLAALNPEFMIELATPILGVGHAAIAQAQQQLDADEYLNSLLTVRDALREINGPKIALDLTSIDFDSVEIGDTQSKELIISNNGTASLDVSNITINNSDFKVNPTAFSIPPIGCQTITVNFTPSWHQVYKDTLVILSNAIDDAIMEIPVSASGVFSQAPKIISIEDVPDDQGGLVKITFYPSRYDGHDSTYQISTYFAERQLKNDSWEAFDPIEASQDSMYFFIAPTLGDSTAGGILWTTFRISAYTDSSAPFYNSSPDSGYSVDNIAPNAPLGLSAQPTVDGILLTWNRNQESDLRQYAIYRSTEANFDPAAMVTYKYATADTFYLDEQASRDTTYYYAISAFDYADNESDFSDKVSAVIVTGVADDQLIPKQYKLYQNFPNPFNAITKIRFDLPNSSAAKISIFNVKGNLVKEISKRDYKAGRHEVILNTVGFATGIYFYKIDAGKFTDVRKLLLIK